MKLPREHGAWAMLLLPFVAAVILSGHLRWTVGPALLVCVAMFVLRDAAAEVYRRKYLWRRESQELKDATRTSLVCILVAGVCGLALVLTLPLMPLIVMGGGASVLMVVAVYLTAHNRLRSLALQLASAAGLTASAFVAWLACGRTIGWLVWSLWLTLFAHSVGGMLTVHARLEARVASRKTGLSRVMQRRAAIAQGVLFMAAPVLASQRLYAIAAALLVSATVHAYDVSRLYKPESLKTRLQVVGVRELILSCVVALLTVAGLW